MGWFLLAHIGLPLLFGTAFIIFSAAVDPRADGWDVLVETALDLTILSLGATGAIFDNLRVEQAFGSNSALVAIAMIAVNLIFSAIIVMARAIAVRNERHFSFSGGIIALCLGVLTLGITAGVLSWAYTHS
ncbi:MAG TPA: hypothetical protein VH022_00340 [Candidatus Acidoferrum sp.]|jgi:hypothetical protein|nr:hypothetical protein [Candidatus Acidoferrum sp.]